MTATSKAIEDLISYGAFDWAVTASEERKVLALFKGDRELGKTIRALAVAGMLEELFERIKGERRRMLVEILGGRLDAAEASLVRRPIAASIFSTTLEHLARVFDIAHGLQSRLRVIGAPGRAPVFDATPLRTLISANRASPLTGSGATGISPRVNTPGMWDSMLMVGGHDATKMKYDNPIPGDLGAYLSGLSAVQRKGQASLILRQKIVSFVPHSYAQGLPSRAQIIRLAAHKHNLHPQLVSAFLLAEQRDQSAMEDGKDIGGAQSVLEKNFSIGLGQVVVSTARRDDLFADLLPSHLRKSLSHSQIAGLLASDEFNIFAVARYIRKIADTGARKTPASLPNTIAAFPGLNLGTYARNSITWPDANIKALASEYTSRAWDDSVSSGWGWFVMEAYNDVQSAGIF
ncbi:MAG: hypothetical protein KAR13_11735 [Desulfobulbaceae bacterium]|nr:hypothetical protein [Desulfobulbaceae bacterium]